ncbi:MupA/Atu3671 family FMN-dependent luciferase-like monooxygenase [Spongiactinospora sp. TRM90649]|uniref:MupA/Atu3671 family FMN-dependent luciferase-like monooxygenase n=1 Tax=Spongiactinospora sp. TRM90649 TaxID=3031114 RepID=UPI0023F7DCDF|nr:MupA/Atu3671 family FMN-dependent luciferase-like monooxygenase [Spongiactinospora sp. TRM90649]MDF5752252.1 aminotransferase class I/II-fold pyridoxal phosphate-dependent enzyme [Spongiactinospora sp. TRM90649]
MTHVSRAPRRAGTLIDILAARAEETPERLAYSYFPAPDSGPDRLTYGELWRTAAGIAGRVRAVGGPGDRVLLLSGLGAHFVGGFLGCMLAGRVPVPVVATHEPAAIAALAATAADCDATAVLAPAAIIDAARALCAGHPPLARLHWIPADGPAPEPEPGELILPEPGDIAFLQYTSGTTTSPRGVIVRHENLMRNLDAVRGAYRHSPESRGVIWLPPHHDMGLIGGILQPLFVGFPASLMSPMTFLGDPLTWLREIATGNAPTTAGGPNFGYSYCVRKVSAEQAADLDLSNWRVAFAGAEPIDPGVLAAFARHFAPSGFRADAFTAGYGLAEATLGVSSAVPGTGLVTARLSTPALERGTVEEVATGGRVIASCGAPMDGTVVIADPHTLERRAPGEIGEIWLNGPGVAAGYWGREEGSEPVFRARLADEPGSATTYLRTGDLGFLRGGELYVTGRLKDLIIIRGRNIVPHDVERSIEASHPEVRRGGCAVVAVDVGGEERLAVLAEIDRSKTSRPEDDLRASIRHIVSRDHALDVHRVVLLGPKEIPKTTSGKIQRVRAGQIFLGRETERGADTETHLRAWLSRQTGLDPATLDPTRPLTSFGFDSLKAVELNTFLEEHYGLKIPAETLFNGLTLATLATHIDSLPSPSHPAPSESASRRAVPPEAAPPQAVPSRAVPSVPIEGAGVLREVGGGPGSQGLDFSLFFFSSDAGGEGAGDGGRYRLFLEAVKFADRHGFRAVWTPERHFHRFGGLFPNPSVLGAAVAATTEGIRIRAGSVVLPLHDPVRVAEEWAVVDNLSGGRVDLSFAVGWNADDFVLAPADYEARAQVTFDGIETVRRLWRGESVTLPNGKGAPTEIRIFPPPVQSEPPLWITCSGGVERFEQAGRLGANILTALLFQDVDELRTKLDAYRKARAAAGHDPRTGHVTLMLHTYLGPDEASVRAAVEAPFKKYLRDSVDLWRRGSTALDRLGEAERATVLDYAFERYYRTSALFGTPDQAAGLAGRLAAAGVDEIACLIDFGVDDQRVLQGLGHLRDLKDRQARPAPPPGDDELNAALAERHALPHRNALGVLAKARGFDLAAKLGDAGLLPFYLDLGDNDGATVVHEGRRLVMLGSNNYLGLTADPRVREAASAAALADGPSVTGSRLMNGSTPAHGELERRLAAFVGREDALLFTTGYQANIGLLSAFVNGGTVLLVDEECHASIFDGAAVGGGRVLRFRHNDLAHLELRLAEDVRSTPAMVMVDGVYSMSGDLAPLPALREICDRYGVPLALDDAHGLGVAGPGGRGVEEEFGMVGASDVLTGTFSKSLASVGGWLAGPRHLMDWVRYYGRSMLFSASIPPPAVAAASAALGVLAAEPALPARVRELSDRWRRGLRELGFDTGTSQTPIVPVIIGSELDCLRFNRLLLARGVYANCVIAPAVAPDRALIRTTVTAAHEPHHLDRALAVFAAAGRESGLIG